MKIKAAKHKDALHYNGIAYPKDEDGYCEIPEDIAIRAGFARRKKQEAVDPESKEKLVEIAAGLGLAAPSTLNRWSKDRLLKEIRNTQEPLE